jgi:hypothetical protein
LLQLNQHNLNQLVPPIEGFQGEEAQRTVDQFMVEAEAEAQAVQGDKETAILMVQGELVFNTLNLSGH